MLKVRRLAAASLCCLFFGNAQATLMDRGAGLIYDDVLNVTWLQDANYALTALQFRSGAPWGETRQWVDGLVYHDSVRNVDYDDWRLPRVLPRNGIAYDLTNSFAGNTDIGFNITGPASELSFMFYVNLGNKGNVSTNGVFPQPGAGLVNTGPFINLQSARYWYGSELDPQPSYGYFAFGFSMLAGLQELTGENEFGYAWAVRDGDVAAITEPSSLALLAAALGVLGLVSLRAKRGAVL